MLKSRLQFLNGKGYMYLEVVGWQNKTHLKVRLWGHGDREEFDRRFVVSVPRN